MVYNPTTDIRTVTQRWKNVVDIFLSLPEAFRQDLLLVDDVNTTGSTWRPAALASPTAGGVKISIATLGEVYDFFKLK